MSLPRRTLIRSTGALLGAVGAGSLLAACGGSSDTPGGTDGAASDATSDTPVEGGTLRAVFAGAGASESLDPFAGTSPVDFVRNDVIYDSLFILRDGAPEPALATDAEPAADGMSFTLRLREGVLWHDGSAFTADDVAHSFRYMSSPDRPLPSELQMYFDMGNVTVEDEHTLTVPTVQPIGDPATMLASFPAKMVRSGATDFSTENAIGTGPYRVAAFEAGRETRLTRFEEYWGGASPTDELVFSSVSDPQARVNAVRTGQADYAGDIPFSTAKAGIEGSDLEIRTAGDTNRTGFAFVLNANRAPFDDPKVRRAARLAVDRARLVETVLLGYGEPGNDLFCKGARYFSEARPLKRDLEEARRLVKEAGAEGAKVVARSAEYEAGYNDSTKLFVQQLREIGLDAEEQIVSLAEFFDPAALEEADSVTFSSSPLPLPVIYGRMAAYPSFALPDDEFGAAFGEAMAARTDAERRTAWAKAQDVMADRGNTVVWGVADILSLARTNVAGIEVRDQAKYPYLGKAGLA
ncbi:ABC transporter substrate-binding protein [Streptomyces alkaliphilus]|uniref:ABC transporter substrate-binding protein n=1 Tax=Streptomyces alkaliphilus TaxID=1472722 RepID=A0A7W3T963_9ACTN|nr:ABC transporter substrate-binding protein [Streptomyces alkaliphilus]MBB0242568.1 ABC transporter substrate-binding protein [Streptomyces alkaliphilus]